jgi:ABC-type transport system substrate-binding protein
MEDKMLKSLRHQRLPLFTGTTFVVLVFYYLMTQAPLITVQTTWTYPSGYDPHGGYIDRLTFVVYPSEDIPQALLALQQGSVYSYDEPVPYDSIFDLEATPGIEVTSELGTAYQQFTFQCQRFPTNLSLYRVALAQALDKTRVVASARGGFAQVMDNPIPIPFDYWSYENQMSTHFYAQDIAGANATLDVAHIIDTPDSPHPGWRYYDADMSGNWTLGDKRGDVLAPNGLKIQVITPAVYATSFQTPLTLIYGMEKCGLQGEIIEVDFNYLMNALETGEFCAGHFTWNIPLPGVPTLLYDFFHTEGEWNDFFYRYNNGEYDYNCTMFMYAPTRLEARNWAWNCCRILLAEMPMIVCYNDENIHAYRTDRWEGYVNQVGINRMGGNPYTFQQIHLTEQAGGPFGCYPTEYITVLSEGLCDTNAILSVSSYDQTIFNLIYSRLWRIDPLDPLTNLAPDLAWNWTLEPTTASGDIQDGMKYTFHLFENITWHDGTPLTAEDVQYSLMHLHPWSAQTGKDVASLYRVDTPNDYTVEIYSNNSGYVAFIQATSVLILPRHIWSPYEAENFTWTPDTPTDLTGTGCYKWVTRIAGQYIILDRYPEWHFAIEHPERPMCPIPYTGDPCILIPILCSVIIIEIIVLVVLYNRRKSQKQSSKKYERD